MRLTFLLSPIVGMAMARQTSLTACVLVMLCNVLLNAICIKTLAGPHRQRKKLAIIIVVVLLLLILVLLELLNHFYNLMQ